MRVAGIFPFIVMAVGGMLLPSLSLAQQHAQPVSHNLDMTAVKPESVGFSSERLERLHALIQETVDKKQLAGAVTILARHGKVVDYRTYGQRDHGKRRGNDQGYDFPRLLDDQAGNRRGDDDSVRGRQVAAIGSDLEVHSGVRASEGLQRSGCGWKDDCRRSGSSRRRCAS